MSVSTFIDPRTDSKVTACARITDKPEELTELHRPCRDNRIYDIERWIQAGRPLQAAPGTVQKRQVVCALGTALEARNHSLVLLPPAARDPRLLLR
jgi:hypothetical protein